MIENTTIEISVLRKLIERWEGEAGALVSDIEKLKAVDGMLPERDVKEAISTRVLQSCVWERCAAQLSKAISESEIQSLQEDTRMKEVLKKEGRFDECSG